MTDYDVEVKRLRDENARLTAEVATFETRKAAMQRACEELQVALEVEHGKRVDAEQEVARLRKEREASVDREYLGQIVRIAWLEWAKEQPNPKPSWLVPWFELPEADREADRRIGEAVASQCVNPEMLRLESEVADLRASLLMVKRERDGFSDEADSWREECQTQASRAKDWEASARQKEAEVADLRARLAEAETLAAKWREMEATMNAAREDAKAGRCVDLDAYLKTLEGDEISGLKQRLAATEDAMRHEEAIHRKTEGMQADMIESLKLRLAEAEAVIAKLPRTADGVPVVPGMKVWHCARRSYGPKGSTEKFLHEGIDVRMPRPYCLGEHCWYDGCQGDDGGGRTWDFTQCYSTREKAEAGGADQC